MIDLNRHCEQYELTPCVQLNLEKEEIRYKKLVF